MSWKEILKKLSDYERAVADEFATDEDMQRPLPVVGTKTTNIGGKEVEYPVNELGNVPYDVHQATLDRQKELEEKYNQLTDGQKKFIERVRRTSAQPPAPLGGDPEYQEV